MAVRTLGSPLSNFYERFRGYIATKYRASRAVVIGGALVIFLLVLAVMAPFVAPYEPEAMDFAAPLSGPSLTHPFGTDNFGRDVFSRVLHGYRISLAVALGAVGVALLVGIPLGLIAGYFGSWLENLIMRPMDILISFPAVVLVVALAGFLGQGTGVMIVAVAVVYLPILVRVMRGSTIGLRQELFVEGARARGASEARLLLRHVLPNALSPLLVQASILMGLAILLEAALSFIGLGTEPPTPSLGLMLAEGRSFMREAPWIVAFPGLAISVAVLGFNLLGDGLREILNPAQKG